MQNEHFYQAPPCSFINFTLMAMNSFFFNLNPSFIFLAHNVEHTTIHFKIFVL